MKKFIAMLMALTMVIALVACGAAAPAAPAAPAAEAPAAEAPAAEAPAEEELPSYTIIFATGSSADLENPQNVGTFKFKELVEERSNGRITVDCQIASALGNVQEIMEQVQMGAIQMCDVENSALGGFVSQCKVWDMPYLFTTLDEVHKIQASDIGQGIQAAFEQIGIKHLAFNDGGFRNFTNNTRPIKTVADFKGLKLRVMSGDAYAKMVDCLGASAQAIAFGDLYDALNNGTVDGQENPLDLIYGNRFYEVQKYLSISNHLYYPRQHMANLDWFNSLPAADQELIAQAAIDACAFQNEYYVEYSAKMLDALKEKGMEVVEDFDSAAAAEACASVWTDFYGEIGGGDAALGEEIVNRISGGEFR